MMVAAIKPHALAKLDSAWWQLPAMTWTAMFLAVMDRLRTRGWVGCSSLLAPIGSGRGVTEVNTKFKKVFKKWPQIRVHFMAPLSRPPYCILDQRPQNQGHLLAPFLGPRFAPRGGDFVAPWVPKFWALCVKLCCGSRSNARPLESKAALYAIAKNVACTSTWSLDREMCVPSVCVW